MDKAGKSNTTMTFEQHSEPPEVALVTACVTDYFEGMYYRDLAKLKRAFHESARLYGYRDGSFTMLPLVDWLSRVSSRAIPAESGELFEMSIESIDLTGDAGIVKVRDLYMGLRFTDYLSIIKFDNHWKIVSKVFYHEPLIQPNRCE